MSAVFSPYEKIMTLFGEIAFEFCDMSPIFFRVGAISSLELVFVSLTFREEGSFVEMLMIFRAFSSAFALVCDLLTACL